MTSSSSSSFSWLISTDILSMLLVGALWGCTNPLLRKGSMETATNDASATNKNDKNKNKLSSSLSTLLRSFLRFQVWLPYALNQSGSIVFYLLLSKSSVDLSMAVPICNALALVFTFVTSWYVLGEPMHKPVQTIVGTVLIMVGVTICVQSSSSTMEEGDIRAAAAAATIEGTTAQVGTDDDTINEL